MRHVFLIAIIATLVVGGGFIIYERQEIVGGRETLATERNRVARHERLLAELRQQLGTTQRELEAIKQILNSPLLDRFSCRRTMQRALAKSLRGLSE